MRDVILTRTSKGTEGKPLSAEAPVEAPETGRLPVLYFGIVFCLFFPRVCGKKVLPGRGGVLVRPFVLSVRKGSWNGRRYGEMV